MNGTDTDLIRAMDDYENGRALSNEVLAILLNYYSDLDAKLNYLGKEFSFTQHEVWNRYEQLRGYKEARERNNTYPRPIIP
jgi:hypothetical protein